MGLLLSNHQAKKEAGLPLANTGGRIMVATTTQTRKAKGREFQQKIAGMIRTAFNLPDPDAVSTSMGQAGIDIQLSDAARKIFPYAVECKKAETVKIWEWLKQAEENGKKTGLIPLLTFSRSRSKTYAVVEMDHFLQLVSAARREE